MRFPGALDAAGGRVCCVPAAKAADPSEALRLDRRSFGFGTEQTGVTRAMRFAEGVSACNQCHGFFVVHRHACEGFAHIPAGGHRIRLPIGAFRVHIDQAHLDRSQRVLKITLTAVAFIAQPGLFSAPIDLFFGRPDVLAAAGKAEGLESHRFECHVAGQDHQIRPGNLAAIFLLDRPQQTAGFIEVAVVGPAVERGKSLVARTCAAAPIGNTVCPCGMPGHANHQPAVMPPVGRPPCLRIGHQGMQILDDCIEVEATESLGVVKALTHRVRRPPMLMQDVQPQLIRPPLRIGLGFSSDCRVASCAGKRALRFI